MHELSIINNVINIVSGKAKELNATEINFIELDIGKMSGIDYDALEFAWQNIPKNHLTKTTELEINKIQGKARCYNCSSEFKINDLYTPCPKCGNFNHEIIQGQELKIKSIKVT